MSKRTNNRSLFSVSEFYCCRCGNKGLSIPRRNGQHRAPGHLKNMYCLYCGQDWNHAEIREQSGDYALEDFQLEMKYNNFDANGQRKIPYRILRGQIKNQENTEEE